MGIFIEVNYKHVGVQGSEAQKKSDEDSLKLAFRNFKKQCERDGVLRKLRQHEFFEKPSEKRRRARARKRANALRDQREKEES